jgi:putative membrane protein
MIQSANLMVSPNLPLLDALAVSLERRWYVVVFLAAYLVLALRHLGARRAALFTAVAAAVSLASEIPSIRVGFPYGLYLYLWGGPSGLDPREPSILGVPCFSTLSYVFLNYAALCAAVAILGAPERPATWRARAGLALASAALVVAIDTVVDPIALRGEKWFLGKIYWYPGGGEHWGVPITNYAGWLLVGTLIPLAYLALERRLATPPPARRFGPALGTGLYFGVLAFNVGVTFWVGERDLGWSSAAIVAPLLALAVGRASLTGVHDMPTMRPEQETRA